MNTPFTARRFSSWLLVAALLCGGMSVSRAQDSSDPAEDDPILTTTALPGAAKTPVLAAQLLAPTIKKAKNGKALRIKTGVSLSNTGTGPAKKVTITAYLSDDGTLSSDDTTLVTLNLADYNNGSGKLGKNHSLDVPLHYKLPSTLAAALVGKYLIFVVSAKNLSTPVTVVYGPIKLP